MPVSCLKERGAAPSRYSLCCESAGINLVFAIKRPF